jgi:hypothetical protein
MPRFPETKTINLIGKTAIIQGSIYYFQPIVFVNAGDYTSWIARGQIRENYDKDDVLANISFTKEFGDSYGGLSYPNSTFFFPTLGATVTSALKSTPVGSSPVVGKSAWVYDIEIVNPQNADEVYKPCRGMLQVLPEVTR